MRLSSAYRKIADRYVQSSVRAISPSTAGSHSSGGGKPTPCSAKMQATSSTATISTAITEAVSSLPMGGSTRRSGRMSGLVMRTTAWQSGLRKSARVHCSSSRARTTNNARDSSVSTTKVIALMSSSASVGSVRTRCGQLARACGGGGAHQRGAVGHGPHHSDARPAPGLERRHAKPRGHGDEERWPGGPVSRERAEHRPGFLGFHREHHHGGAGDGRGVVGRGGDGELAREALARGGARLADAQVLGSRAGAQQPRDEGAPHVAGSEYRDAPVGHGGVHCTGWIGRKRLRRFRRANPSVTANTPAKGVTFAGEKMALEGAFAGPTHR